MNIVSEISLSINFFTFQGKIPFENISTQVERIFANFD